MDAPACVLPSRYGECPSLPCRMGGFARPTARRTAGPNPGGMRRTCGPPFFAFAAHPRMPHIRMWRASAPPPGCRGAAWNRAGMESAGGHHTDGFAAVFHGPSSTGKRHVCRPGTERSNPAVDDPEGQTSGTTTDASWPSRCGRIFRGPGHLRAGIFKDSFKKSSPGLGSHGST